MGRHAIRINTLSLDTISIINHLYPTLYDFWLEHLVNMEVTPVNFYQAMRHDLITKDLEDLIETSLEWKLRQFGWDREELSVRFSTLPTEDEIITKITAFMESIAEATRNADVTLIPDIETQSQIMFYLKFRAHLSSFSKKK